MPAPLHSTQGIALKIESTGESFLRLRLLTPDLGLLVVLRRAGSKQSSPAIDLYDQGELQVELKPDGGGFLKDFALQRPRRALGRSYAALEAAAQLSRFFLANPIHEDNRAELFALAEKALDALEAGHSRRAILFKTFFVYSRQEGYPVAEDWMPSLEPSLRSAIAALLRTPLKELPDDDPLHGRALEALSAYLERSTHIALA